MNVRFVVIEPASKRNTFRVRLPIVVGRSEEAKFRIQQDRVSRKHCEFFGEEGSVFVRDLGSTNGTLLGGELLETHVKTPIAPGAVVQVGSLKFRIEYDAPANAPAANEPADRAEMSDVTVGAGQAADSERLQIEHTAASEPAESVEAVEATAEALPEDVAVEEPVAEESFTAESAAEELEGAAPSPSAVGGDFGWLPGSTEATNDVPDDDKLGDFFKGLK